MIKTGLLVIGLYLLTFPTLLLSLVFIVEKIGAHRNE